MAEEDVEEEGSGGGKKKFIIIIIVVLLLLGGAGAAYYFMFMGENKEEALNPDQTSEQQSESESGNQGDPLKMANPIFTPPTEYTVNLRDGKHFLKMSLVAVLEDPSALAYLAMRMPLIDDMVISLLHNMTTEDLKTPAGIELLKRELYKKANSIFTREFIMDSDTQDQFPVKKILFKEFLIN